MAAHPGTTTYRLGFAHVLRLLGPAVIGLGVAWLLLAALGGGGVLRGLLALLTVVVVVAALVLLLRPPAVLRLSDDGYRITWIRGSGDPAASWGDVTGVGAQRVGDAMSLVFELADGRTSTLPLTLLGARNAEAQREVHDRLNTAHGYRRL